MTYSEYQRDYFKNIPKGVYIRQKANARRRTIPWEFTFDSWWKLWEDSGHWGQRGTRRGDYCMARKNDQGPYSPENCLIIPFGHNSRCAILRTKPHLEKENASKPVIPQRLAKDLCWKCKVT